LGGLRKRRNRVKKLVACAVLTAAMLAPASGAAAEPLPAGVEPCYNSFGQPAFVFWTTDLNGDGRREEGSFGCM
jgi:hypothetical protein